MNDEQKLALQAASAAFLTDQLPDQFFKLDEADQDAMLVDLAWEPVSHLNASQLWELIDSHAYTIREAAADIINVRMY